MNLCINCKLPIKDSRSIRCKSCSKMGKLNPAFGVRKVISKEIREKASKNQMGENNSNWKGDNVGYLGVHSWVNKHKNKPKLCEECNKTPPYDLANISGEYKRDLYDWEYLCRKCHMIKDGRIGWNKGLRKINGHFLYI